MATTPQLYKTTGIIIKRNNSGEGDKILSVLCIRIGKKRFIGKGIRKIGSRRSGHIELFSKTDFLVHRGKSLDYITGATVVHFYGISYHTLYQLASAYTACEVVDRLVMEGQEHDEVYKLLDGFLTDIKTTDQEHILSLTKQYVDRVLYISGYTRKETESASLGSAIASVERVVERKIRSINFFSKSGIDVFKRISA